MVQSWAGGRDTGEGQMLRREFLWFEVLEFRISHIILLQYL